MRSTAPMDAEQRCKHGARCSFLHPPKPAAPAPLLPAQPPPASPQRPPPRLTYGASLFRKRMERFGGVPKYPHEIMSAAQVREESP
jgi:hypothetical protein